MMTEQYPTWLSKARNILGFPTERVADGEWRFDWYASYVVGCRPYEAVEDARAELRDRGITITDECPYCGGEGRIAAYGDGDQAGGYADTCQECKGTGRAA